MTKIKGKVVLNSGGLFGVECTGTAEKLFCSARGLFRSKGVKVLVGDNVLIDEDEHREKVISEISDRVNSLIRPPIANLDVLFCCVSAAHPEPSTLMLDKLITIAEHNSIEPVIVITKAVLDENSADALYRIYNTCGFTTFVTSANEGVGIAPLNEYLMNISDGKTSAFSGVSGVGKSTLLNTVCPELCLKTGSLSERIDRGKNTTRSVELFRINGSYIADTPGFSLIDFVNFDFYTLDDLPFEFREFRPHIPECRYSKCTHRTEEGCAVISSVMTGNIPESRHESYCSIYNDLKDKHRWDKK